MLTDLGAPLHYSALPAPQVCLTCYANGYDTNIYMQVGVCRVEELATVVGTPVALILVAPRHDAVDGAWRLLFERVSAYQRLPVEAHAGAYLTALREAY